MIRLKCNASETDEVRAWLRSTEKILDAVAMDFFERLCIYGSVVIKHEGEEDELQN